MPERSNAAMTRSVESTEYAHPIAAPSPTPGGSRSRMRESRQPGGAVYARVPRSVFRDAELGQAIPYFLIFRATVDWFTPSAWAMRAWLP